MEDLRLYIPSAAKVYDGSSAIDRLLEDLYEQDRYTVVSELDHPDQVLLVSDGKTRAGGLRFSGLAFRQVCSLLSPGLYPLLADLAGFSRRDDESAPRGKYSLVDAAHVLNLVVARRFRACLAGLQMVRDTRAGIIEGVVGRTYRRLANAELCAKAQETLASLSPSFHFHHAVVAGRRLSFSYRSQDPVFEVAFSERVVDTFHTGFYYSNSEAGGSSVRASPALIRGRDDVRMIGDSSDYLGSTQHSRKNFERRLDLLMTRVVEKRPNVDFLRKKCLELASTGLGFVGKDDADDDRFQALVRKFHEKGLPRTLAKKILRNVLVQGGFDAKPYDNVDYVQRSTWARRTGYDLFISMLRVAKHSSLHVRELLESRAYKMLVGKFLVLR